LAGGRGAGRNLQEDGQKLHSEELLYLRAYFMIYCRGDPVKEKKMVGTCKARGRNKKILQSFGSKT